MRKYLVFCILYFFVSFLYAEDYVIKLEKSVSLNGVSKNNIQNFLYNINYVYIYLMPGHLDVKTDCENIYCSKLLYIKEKQDSDVAEHNYDIIIKPEEVVFLSNNSIATKWKLFKINFSTSVDFIYRDNFLSVILTLKFKTQKDLDNFIEYSKNIWEDHFNLEIDNAIKVFVYLQRNDLLNNHPNTWININFKEILK